MSTLYKKRKLKIKLFWISNNELSLMSVYKYNIIPISTSSTWYDILEGTILGEKSNTLFYVISLKLTENYIFIFILDKHSIIIFSLCLKKSLYFSIGIICITQLLRNFLFNFKCSKTTIILCNEIMYML